MLATRFIGSVLLPAVALASSWQSKFEPHYDAIVLGTGLKESIISGLLANEGKRVLQLERSAVHGASMASVDLQELSERTIGADEKLSAARLGKPEDFSIDAVPKVFMAAGAQLQLLVKSGAWSHMEFKRVQRSLLYRLRPDGTSDVHRVLANAEDVMKTRSLKPLDKANVLRLFVWVEKYDEDNRATHVAGLTTKRTLDLHRMSAAGFLKYWDLPADAIQMITRGLALFSGPTKMLKKMPAIELVNQLKRYKDAYKTFTHMTSPYVFPVGGFGTSLPRAIAPVLEESDGCQLLDRPVDRILFDESGAACGVESEGVQVKADCVIAGPEYVEDRVEESYKVVRLFAVLAHPPNMCKEATSCQCIFPAQQCDRKNDVYMFAAGPLLSVAPKGKWLVVASTRVEGSVDDATALAVAKRELSVVLPLLKPAKKLFAEIRPQYELREGGEAPGLHICTSCDAASHFDSVEADVTRIYEELTGETLA